MKTLFSAALIFIIAYGNCQNVLKYTPQHVPKTYVPMNDIELLNKMLQMKQAEYDANKDFLYKLQNVILDLKSESQDKGEIAILNKYYQQLEIMKDKDLGALGDQLKNKALSLKNELIEYKKSLSISNTTSNTSYSSPPSANERYDMRVIKTEAKMRYAGSPVGEIIFIIPKGQVVKVFSFNDNYYKIEYNGRMGYVNDLYFE